MQQVNPCEGLLEKTYGQVVRDDALRKQLWRCLHTTVFMIDGLSFSLDGSNFIKIELSAEFFNRPDLQWNEKPSDTKIKRFYEILLKLQEEFEHDFMVSGTKPDITNLSLKLKFPLSKFRKERKQQMDAAIIDDLLKYLNDLWQQLLERLSLHGYNLV